MKKFVHRLNYRLKTGWPTRVQRRPFIELGNLFGGSRSESVSLPRSLSSLVMDAAEPAQRLTNPREVDAFFYDDEHSSSGGSTISSSSAQVQPPATTDIDLMSPPPDKLVQISPEFPPQSATAAPDSDEDDEEMPDLYIPALIAPTMFLPIPNVRPSYFF